MKPLREVLLGLSSVIATALVVFGAVSAGISEGFLSAVLATEPVDELRILTILPGMPTPRPKATQILKIITLTPTTVFICPTPKGWQTYTVQPGDTISELAASRGITDSMIVDGNCLFSSTLSPGTTLQLPRLVQSSATPTPSLLPSLTPLRCGPPRTWVRYIVQPNDTLFKLSILFGVSVTDLQVANCLTDTLIRVGEVLYVPNVPTRTLSPTPTTPSRTPLPPTRTFTVTFTPTITLTPSKTPTRTVTPTFTRTFMTTSTSTRTNTPTPTPTFTRTPTSTATVTPTRTLFSAP